VDEIGVFLSYSHEDAELATEVAGRLRASGLLIWIDQMEMRAGDSLIEKIATAIREMEFLVALVTPASIRSSWCKKELSLALTDGLGREGVKVVPVQVGDVPIPATLTDTYCLPLDPSNVESAIENLVADIRSHHEERTSAVTSGEPLPTGSVSKRVSINTGGSITPAGSVEPQSTSALEPVRIVGIVKEGVGQPRNDGTAGSGLYRVPLRLSRIPSARWAELFVRCWSQPPSWTTMHRPGILSVQGDTLVLDGTTLDELESVHVRTLQLCISSVNDAEEELLERDRQKREAKERAATEHQRKIDEAAERIQFED
jgi:hypothetical protein